MGLLSFLAPLEKARGAQSDMPDRTIKSWQMDPMAYMDSTSHKERLSSLSYDQLRAMAMRCDVVMAILQTRVNQVAAFSEPQPDKYSLGYTVQMRNGRDPGTRASAQKQQEIMNMIQYCGIPGMAHDGFEAFLRKITRDSLIYDQMTFEVVPRRNGVPAFWEAVDASTIRFAAQAPSSQDNLGRKNASLEETAPFQDALQSYQKDLLVQVGNDVIPAKYVQLINGTVRTTYADGELYFGVRNPRTDLAVGGYGMSELETLIGVITSYLYAEEYNRRIFSQGSIPKGILNLKGEITDQQLASFRREWNTLIAGVQNAWKTPVLNAEDIEYINLQTANKDMEYMQWIQFLVRLACGVYLIDPAEINFDMPRGLDSTNPLIESSNEAKLRASKDRGLYPLLRFIQRAINESIVYKIDPDFEFRFAGINARTIEQQQASLIQGVNSYQTLNEVRAKDDLPPLPFGDTPLNPTYVSMVQAQQQMMLQQQQMAMMAEQGGASE